MAHLGQILNDNEVKELLEEVKYLCFFYGSFFLCEMIWCEMMLEQHF